MKAFSGKLNTAKATARMEVAGAGALIEGAEHLLRQANRGVPHDEGTLELSGAIGPDTVPGVIGAGMRTAVSYDTKYAARLHESAPGEFNFQRGRRRKWLEHAMIEERRSIREHVARQMRKNLMTSL